MDTRSITYNIETVPQPISITSSNIDETVPANGKNSSSDSLCNTHLSEESNELDSKTYLYYYIIIGIVIVLIIGLMKHYL